MKYITASFYTYDNGAMDKWLNEQHSKGYIVERIIACGSNSILIVMRK